MNEDLSLLKDEIEIFNSDLKLLKNPIWLSSQKNRQINRHATILIAVENAKQDQICSHTILKCSNYEENHTANSNTCEFKTSIENKSTKYSQNMQKKQQTKSQSFQVVIDNVEK